VRLRALLAVVATCALPAAAQAADGSLAFRASATPRTSLFGDPVTAEVLAVAPAGAADAMRVETDFAPYRVVGPVEIERTRAGDRVQVLWRWRLECLTRACVPDETQRRVVFGPARITLPAGGGEARVATATWPALIIRSRLGLTDRARPEQRATVYPLGPPTYRAEPTTVQRLLWVGAAVCALAALAVLLPFLGRVPLPRRGFNRLGPAERALVLARRAARSRDPGRRRTALERLQRELARGGAPDLAAEASRLAWAAAPPESEAMTGLVSRAERELRGAR
jgi:hypothetical protein